MLSDNATFDDVLRAVQPKAPMPPRTPPPPLTCVGRPARRTRSANKENSSPRKTVLPPSTPPPSSPRICVLRPGAFVPHTPPRENKPPLSEQPKFRMRRAESAAKLRAFQQVSESAAATVADEQRSRSVPSLRAPVKTRETPMCTVLSAKRMRQRARSAPVRRPPPPESASTLQQRGASCLGASLHHSSGAMLRASALRPFGLPAARVFLDPATGKEAYMRPMCRNR